MATKWYCQLMGQLVGPWTASELLARIRAGEVTADTLIRKDDSQWVAAREVNGLLQAAGLHPETSYRCPFCGHLVSKPPVRCSQCRRQLDSNMAYPVAAGDVKVLPKATSAAEPAANGAGDRSAVPAAGRPHEGAGGEAASLYGRLAAWARSWFGGCF